MIMMGKFIRQIWVNCILANLRRNHDLSHCYCLPFEPRNEKTNTVVPNRSDINRAVQAQKMARSLEFRIKDEEELYYLGSEYKGTDQLRDYYEADLCLCFLICKTLVFS